MADHVLTLQGIHKSFGGVTVLNNVDFCLKRGSVHALVGGNGAGKSTLMKILTGIYFADAGTISINDEVKEIKSFSDARKNGIGIIFQELSLVPTLTVTENIFLNNEIKHGGVLDKKTMNQRTRELINSLGIDINVEEKIENLDVGYCQLIEIAKALSEKFSILVMDEPTASLSDKETEILFRIIRDLKSKGVSIVYISHRMNEIFQIADEISVLWNGRIVVSQPTVDYTMESLIRYMMGETNEKAMAWKERVTPIGDRSILDVRQLTLRGKLDDVTFSVHAGEVVGLAGLMGSGRTEILECIFGKRRYDAGEIRINGELTHFRSIDQAIKRGIALVPEDRRRQGLVLAHPLQDNVISTNYKSVLIGGVIRRSLVRQISERAIAAFGIKTNGIQVRMLNLSGGNQQKVVIAKWMNIAPKILLMDEPTAGVDIGAKAEIIDIIRQFTAQGNAVVFVSSELSEMMAICDRIIVLSAGKISETFDHAQIHSEEVLQHAIQK